MAGWAVGVDLGGTNVRAAAVTRAGTTRRAVGEAVDRSGTPGPPFGQLVAVVRRLLDGSGDGAPAGIGIGATGPADPVTGVIDNPHTLPPSMQGDVVSALRTEFGLPVVLENDADVVAVAEARFGAGRDTGTVACVTVGTGIGVGVVSGGAIHRGSAGAHPEAGHLVVRADGPPCYCGARGCLESLASGTGVLHRARERGAVPDGAGAEDVFRAAARGVAACAEIVAEAADALALGVRNLVAVHAAGVVVLSGGALGDAGRVRVQAQAAVDSYLFRPAGGTRVELARLGALAGCVGAAALVLAP